MLLYISVVSKCARMWIARVNFIVILFQKTHQRLAKKKNIYIRENLQLCMWNNKKPCENWEFIQYCKIIQFSFANQLVFVIFVAFLERISGISWDLNKFQYLRLTEFYVFLCLIINYCVSLVCVLNIYWA